MIHTEKIAHILCNLKIEELNPMQHAMLNSDLTHKDIILLSPTGSGKTLAFLLPLLENLGAGVDTAQVLILSPSRELALQTTHVFNSMNASFKAYCCYGGHSVDEEKKSIRNAHPAVIVSTPGRILDHLRRGNLAPATIHTLIIDEFDKSLELGFEEEMKDILLSLRNLKKRMLVSATDMDDIPAFTGLTSPVKLNFLLPDEEQERLKLLKVHSPTKDKINTLYHLLCALGNQSTIVFCNHRESVERVCKLLNEKNIYAIQYHGGMEQADREQALFKFRNGSCFVLISTDLASRGLDIPEVEHIVHYHFPVTEEAFTHRNGRTARWKASGNSYLILHESESIPTYIPSDIAEYILPDKVQVPGKPLWVTIYIGKGKRDKLSKSDVVGFLYKKGRLSGNDVGMVEVKERYSLVAVRRDKIKQLLSQIADEKIKGIKTKIQVAN